MSPGKALDRDEAHRARRRFGSWKEGLATVVVAGLLAVFLACVIEIVLMLLGALVGDPAGHRDWIDQHLARIAGLQSVPLPGPIAPAWDSTGFLRDAGAFGLVLFFCMLVPARRIGPTWVARFDGALLRPWPASAVGQYGIGPTGDAQIHAWKRLHAWCHAGAGTGRSPFWRPWVKPEVTQRFSVAVLTGPPGAGKSPLAAALGRELDGSLQLEACTSRFEALRLRLRVKRDDCRWWRPRQHTDPWDSGELVQGPAAQARLARFAPRRATLVVADALPPDALRVAIETLNAQSAGFHHPVRLLVLDAVLPSSLDLRWDADRAVWTSALQELGDVLVIEME